MSSKFPLKTILLTTDTPHHLYFAWKLADLFSLQAIIIETGKTEPPFETFHPFEALRDKYEREVLLAGCERKFPDLAKVHHVPSVNDRDSVSLLEDMAPEVIIVFGTGKISPQVIKSASRACLNLHGGNPEHYRGLDTHLWAIYHNDFANLVTTLHYVAEGLDTGDIVFQSELPVPKHCELHELRSLNTKICVDLSLTALEVLKRERPLPRRKQLQFGRYYSFMPSVLKEICVKKFGRYVSQL